MRVIPKFHCEVRSDASDYQMLLAGPWDLEYRQLSRGSFSAANTGVTIGESVVYEETFNRSVSVYGALVEGMLGFSLPNKAARLRGRWWGADFPSSAISFATGGREIDVSFPSGYRNFLVLVPEEAFRAYFFDVTGTEPNFFDQCFPHLNVDPLAFSACRSGLERLIAMPKSQKPPADAIFSIMAEALASSLQLRAISPCGANPRLNSRVVREAIEIWKVSGYELSIAELSRGIGVSQRTLEHGFRDHFNLTPYQYLIRCRLGFVRDALRAADPACNSVTDIAVRYGFHELGRFAGKYREFFGELPSDTLSQRAGSQVSYRFPPE